MYTARSILVLTAVWLSACTCVPVAAIPDPLPETLAWATSGGDSAQASGAFLGLEVRENDSGSLEALSFDPGVRVTRVAAGSPAQQAGLRIGDVLLRWEGEGVADPETLEALLAQGNTEAPTRLEVQRGDSVFDVEVRLRAREGAAPKARLAWRADPARSRAGWLAGQEGVVLVATDPEGPFPRAGIALGSVVTHLDGVRQRSERALIRAMLEREPGAEVEVDFIAKGEREPRRASVELYDPPRRVTEAGVPILIGYEADADGDSASFYLLDLWIISLFEYRRENAERHYSFLSVIDFSSGLGELEEGE